MGIVFIWILQGKKGLIYIIKTNKSLFIQRNHKNKINKIPRKILPKLCKFITIFAV